MMDSISAWRQVIGITIGATATVIVAYFTFKGKANKEDQDDCIEALKELEKHVIALEDSLKQERILRGIVEGNWEGMKLAFKVAFDEYDHRFENQPQQMGMLKTLREIINK